MARDVVSPRSARVSATLVIARMILFTVLRVLAPLMVRSVLDLCTAKTLHPFSLAYSDFIDHTLPEIPSMVLALGSELCAAVLFAKPSFLPRPLADCNLFTIASYLVSAIDSFLPAPPVQFCVIGSSAGIRCGATRYRPTSSEVVDRLLRYLAGLTLSFYRVTVSALSCKSSSIGGLVVCCLVLLFCFVFVFARSLWILHSLETPLDEKELYIIIEVDASLARARDRALAMLDWFKRRMSSALVSVYFVHRLWKATCPSVLEYRTGYLGLHSFCQSLASWHKAIFLSGSPITRYALAGPLVLVVIGELLYVLLFVTVIWKACYSRKKLETRAVSDASRILGQQLTDNLGTTEPELTESPSCDEIVAPEADSNIGPSQSLAIDTQPLPHDTAALDTYAPAEGVRSSVLGARDQSAPLHGESSSGCDCARDSSNITTDIPAISQEHAPTSAAPCEIVPATVPANTTCSCSSDSYHIHPDFHAKYELGSLIGAGTFGFVYQARRRADGQEFAVKFIQRADDSRVGRAWVDHLVYGRVPYEVAMLHGIQHDNVVSLEEVFKDDVYVYVVQELHGTLWYPRNEAGDLIESLGSRSLHTYLLQNGPMPLSDAVFVFKQLVDAVLWCHSRGLSHCDIKPENMVIDADLTLKLIDFGGSLLNTQVPRPWYQDPRVFGGTRIYNAPELHRRESFQPEKADTWALGAVLYEMLTSERAFEDIEMIKAGVLDWEPGHMVDLKGLIELRPVIEGCLQQDPKKRWSTQRLSKHRLLQ